MTVIVERLACLHTHAPPAIRHDSQQRIVPRRLEEAVEVRVHVEPPRDLAQREL